MELELMDKKDQPLLSRVDVTFRIAHPNERTPKRDEVREELANQMKVKKSSVIVDNMKSDFGKSVTIGFAKIYKSDKVAKVMEREHILVRNKLVAGKEKVGGAKKKEEKKEVPKEGEQEKEEEVIKEEKKEDKAPSAEEKE